MSPYLVGIVLAKVTLLLVLAWGIARGLRRGSAAQRHLVWAMALAGVLLIPALAWSPGWQVLPSASTVAVVTPSQPFVERIAALPEAVAAGVPSTGLPASQTEVARSLPEPRSAAPKAVAAGTEPEASASLPDLWTLVFFVWSVGAALLALRILVGWFALGRLVRSAEPVVDPRSLSALAAIHRGMGLRRPVTLLRGAAEVGPMTWGVVWPVVFLPSDSLAWSGLRLRAALTHELAHVARMDCGVQWLARVVRSLFWFHPLVWVAVRQLSLEQERACDDRVLADGVKPSVYADELLSIAAAVRKMPVAAYAGTAMARPSELVARLQYLLDDRPATRKWGRRSRWGALLGAGASTLLLGALHPETGARPETESRSAAASAQDKPPQKGTQDKPKKKPTGVIQVPMGTGKQARAEVLRWIAELGDPLRVDYADRKLRSKRAEATPALIRALKSPNPQIRIRVARILSLPTPASPEVGPALVKGATDVGTPPEARLGIIQALAICIDRDDALFGRVSEAASADGPGSEHLVHALTLTRNRPEVVLPRLAEFFRKAPDDDWGPLIAKVHALGDSSAAVQLAIGGLANRSPRAVLAAIEGLRRKVVHGREGRDAVAVLRGHQDPAVRAAAAKFIAMVDLREKFRRPAILIADYSDNCIVEFDSKGEKVLELEDIFGAWDVEKLANGNYLITEFSVNRVREITRDEKIVWRFDDLKNPYDADRLPNGNTLIADTFGRRVIEVDKLGKIVWKYDKGIHPYDVDRLANGNTLIADPSQDRVIEVDKAGKIVWKLENVANVHDADRLANGNTLVTIRMLNEVREVDKAGKTVFQLRHLASPSDADRLPDGNTLVAENGGVRVFSPDGVELCRWDSTWAVEANLVGGK